MSIIAGAVAAVVLAPGSAAAASADIQGFSDSGSWVFYLNTRTVTTQYNGDVSIAVNQMLGSFEVSLRLRTPSNGSLSQQRHWFFETDRFVRKSFGTFGTGTQFNMSACCYSGGSTTWSGNLRW
jgi:hypothetical protein